jgi:UDP-N-acetylmuramyl pentapeptide phosphotransferase/UDP-N-acetylglucosamine-1-phosphate transferase
MSGLSHAEWLDMLITALSSLACCALIVITQRWHGQATLDHDTAGDQKFHKVPVPRIGGVAVVAGMLAGGTWGSWLLGRESDQTLLMLLLCGAPAFLVGFLEDITKKVSVRQRMLGTLASAALAASSMDVTLTNVDLPLVDQLLSWSPWLAFALTCVAVSGMANALNIIDGFNGLAGLTSISMLIALAGLAWLHQDWLVMRLTLVGAVALVGFLVLNFPFGRIFLGDGGAYLIGFWIAECAILLLKRNEGISTWAVLLCCIYPVWETLFSMWRKSFLRKTGMSQPDKLHLHMLVYRRWVPRFAGLGCPTWARHLITSLIITGKVQAFQGVALLATALGSDQLFLMAGVMLYIVVYGFMYKRLVIKMAPDNSQEQVPLSHVH